MKAISPVIATVIIVAVAIAISIAVALWMTGMTGSFTGIENLEIVYVNAEAKTVNVTVTNEENKKEQNVTVKYWLVTITVKNTGTKPTTIDNIFINKKPGNMSRVVIEDKNKDWTLEPGETITITFKLLPLIENETVKQHALQQLEPIVDDPFTSGQMVSIDIHTASGRQYPATVTLP